MKDINSLPGALEVFHQNDMIQSLRPNGPNIQFNPFVRETYLRQPLPSPHPFTLTLFPRMWKKHSLMKMEKGYGRGVYGPKKE